MERWERAARDFLGGWPSRRHVTGALVCGSYVTGHPTPRSDVDCFLLLPDATKWRERGNRIVDGLLVEYFANPPEQIRLYFASDFAENRRVIATIFCTGRVLFDRDGEVKHMQAEARRWHRKRFPRLPRIEFERTRYAIWDAVDNTLDAAERGSPDLPFQYHHAIRFVYDCYAKFLRQPVLQVDRIERFYGSGAHPEKYLLEPFPDNKFIRALLRAIREDDPAKMPGRLKRLAAYATEQMGGFEIDGWRFRSEAEG